ncbi:MAG: alpha-amylase family glycosyl hydrolase [Ilumatobacteraceae bacterium]
MDALGARTRLAPDLTAAVHGLYLDRVDDVVARLVARRRAADERSAALGRATSNGWRPRTGTSRTSGSATWRTSTGSPATSTVSVTASCTTELLASTRCTSSRCSARDGERRRIRRAHHLSPDPRLGTTDDLVEMIDRLHRHGIDLCLDFVLNHTSDDHAWAVAARAGSSTTSASTARTPIGPNPIDGRRRCSKVFPDMAPGNFTWNDTLGRWVWTATFREFQWDLDYSNPDVLVEVAGLALELANYGVDILRLGAIAFT